MRPLAPDDFPAPALTRAAARATVPYLPDEAFEARWKAAMAQGPLLLLRSFPALWWCDLRDIDPARVPPDRGLGFGDAHPDNFGFLTFDDGRVGYAFNDLDDSGEVEVALDALRYFTAAALWRGPGAPVDVPALVTAWREALATARDPVHTDRTVLDPLAPPDPTKMRRKALERWSTEPELPAVTRDELAELRAALRRLDETRAHTVLAARRRTVRDGGSGGLQRFWALVCLPRRDEFDVLELKARAPAAAEQGARARKIDKRLSTLKKILWAGRTMTPYHRVDLHLDGKTLPFVVRSRGARAPLPATLPPPFHLQAHILAAVHRDALRDTSPATLAHWVEGSVPTLVARWKALASAP